MKIKEAFSIVKTISTQLPEWLITIIGQEATTKAIEIEHYGDISNQAEMLNEDEVQQVLEYIGQLRGAASIRTKHAELARDVDDLILFEEDINIDAVEMAIQEVELDVEGNKEGNILDGHEEEALQIINANNLDTAEDRYEANSYNVNVDMAYDIPTFNTPEEEMKSGKGSQPVKTAAPLRSHRLRPIPQTPAIQAYFTPVNRANNSDTEEEFDKEEFLQKLVTHPLKQPDWDAAGSDSSDIQMRSPTGSLFDPTSSPLSSTRGLFTPTSSPLASTRGLFTPTSSPLATTQRLFTPTSSHASTDHLSNPHASPSGLSINSLSSESRMASPHLGEELVTTEYLQSYGLVFNTRYKLLICKSCGAGFPFNNLHTHINTPASKQMQRMFWNSKSNDWKLTPVFLDHEPSISLAPSKAKFEANVVQSLITGGYITQRTDILNGIGPNEWKDIALSVTNSIPCTPVLGLRIFPEVRKCTITGCTQISTSKAGNSKHYSRAHPNSRALHNTAERVSAQTLCEDISFTHYFEVTPPFSNSKDKPHKSKDAPSISDSIDIDTAVKLLQQKKSNTMALLDVVPETDLRTILPVYVQTGVHGFLAAFDRQTIRKPFIRNPRDFLYKRLQESVATSFKNDVELVSQVHHSVLAQMTNCSIGAPTRFKRRAFAALTEKSSIAKYASLELKLVWTLVQAYRSVPGSKGLFVFNQSQTKALQQLLTQLEARKFRVADVIEALYKLFDVIYYPKEPNTGLTTFNSPVIVFLALECLTDTGEYQSIFLIPPVIAMVQYAIRLRATHLFRQWFQGTEPQKSILEKCYNFSTEFLQDYNLSPFSTVRLWMNRFSLTSKATPRAVHVWWQENTVTVGETVIDFEKYKAFLHRVLEETERQVERDVLFNIYTMRQIEEKFKISQLKGLSSTDDVLGNGILFDARNETLDNPESNILFTDMLRNKSLGMDVTAQGSLRFDKIKSLQWLAAIDSAMDKVMPLCHVLQGPPGRMTEESLLPLTNTAEASSAAIFEPSAKTGGFRSGYHKGAFISGDHKHILRLVPYRIFALLYVLIRLVRPIELAVLFEFVIKEDKRQIAVTDYRERIFASNGRAWNALHMGRALEQFFKEGMKVKMGVRTFRHYAIAIQRHFPKTNYLVYNTEQDDSRLAAIADLMAGHSTVVAEQSYARTSNIVTGLISKADCIRICQDWHTLHGFSTSMEEGADDNIQTK